MSTRRATFAGMAGLLTATALTVSARPAAAEVPQVAADIAPVQSLVARVMEGLGTPELIVQPGSSPHGYSMRPSEARGLQEAAAVFWVGPELEPWLEDAIATLAPEARAVELLEAPGTRTLQFRTGATFAPHDHDHEGHDAAHDEAHGDHAEADHDDHGGHDDHAAHGDEDHAAHGDEDHASGDHAKHEHEHDEREHEAADHEADHESHAAADHDAEAHHDTHGHSHEGTDPHAWLDPDNAAAWLDAIAATLSEIDPDNADAYARNAADGRTEIAAAAEEAAARLAPVADVRFVVFHDAYQYFETRFGLSAAGAIELGDASDPSPARIEEVRGTVQDLGATCVFSEPQFNQGLVRTVIDGTEAGTGVIDPLGADIPTGPDFYTQLIRAVADEIASCAG